MAHLAGYPAPDADEGTGSSTSAETDRMREVDLDAVVRRQTPTRTRVIQGGVLLALLLVVGGLVLGEYWAGQAQPTFVAVDFSMNAAIFSNVNHGTLIVNGTKFDAHPPVTVTLHPGTNTISITAPPFRLRTCRVDLSRQPAGAGEPSTPVAIPVVVPCGNTPYKFPVEIGGKEAATQVEMPLIFTDLPSEQRPSVEAAIAQEIAGLALHIAVPAHQYIVTGVDAQGHITSRLTDTTLHAGVALVRYAGQVRTSDATCVENLCAGENSPQGLCGVSDASGTATTGWGVTTFVVPQWRFTTPTGDTAALAPLNIADQTLLQVPLQYDAAHGWRPWGTPGWGSDCDAHAIMANMQCGAGSSALSAYGPVNVASISPNGIEGCDIQVLNSSGKFARFIWRFGVLLAADAAAHQLVPSLPVAPQAEIDAVTKQA